MQEILAHLNLEQKSQTGSGNGSLTGLHRCCGTNIISNAHGLGNGIGFGFGRYTTCEVIV